MSFSVISAISCEKIFDMNLGISPNLYDNEIIFKKNVTNICKAYNEAVREAKSDYLIFVHQDVYLPLDFFKELLEQIDILNKNEHAWGIIGPAGRNDKALYKGHILDRCKAWGEKSGLPAEVQTLDELCLVARKDIFEKISFDENIPNQHLFGSDICMQALENGYTNFAIDAFCYHNSKHGFDLPAEFFAIAEYLKVKWQHMLPIYSTCMIIGADKNAE